MSKLNCSNCKYYDFNACDGVDWCKLNHEETGICGYCDREFEDLEEATTHYDALVEENNTFLMENSKMAGEIKDLQSQLAEKNKEIEKINACVDFYKSYYISFNGKVIDELEKVKEKLLEELQNVTDLLDLLEYEDYHELIGCGRGYKNSIEEIENQIKQLKRVK